MEIPKDLKDIFDWFDGLKVRDGLRSTPCTDKKKLEMFIKYF